MFLALAPDELEISHAAAAFLGKEFPLERLHANPRDEPSLDAFAQLGWFAFTAPESAGGVGLSIVEEMLFFLELGKVAGPLAALTQTLAVATARDDTELCAKLVAGECEVAWLVEQRPGGSFRLVGNASAQYALAVSPDSATLYALDGSTCREVPCLDRSVSMYLGDAPGALQPVLGCAGNEVWQKAQVGVSAMMVGLAETAMTMIVAYAKVRETFGRAIGSYQAVRHPCADMAVRIEAARCQLFYAATACKEAQPDAAMQLDAAQLLAVRAAKQNTDANIQLHGGIGVTDEHSAHLLLKRANLLERLLGSARSASASLLDLERNRTDA